MRGLRSHQNLAAPEHLQFWAPLTAAICISTLPGDTEDGAVFPREANALLWRDSKQRGFQFVFLSHVLLHNSPVCDSTLSIMKENYFLWKCLYFFLNSLMKHFTVWRQGDLMGIPLFSYNFLFSPSLSQVSPYLCLSHSFAFFSHVFAHCSSLPHILLSSFPHGVLYQTCWNVCCLDVFQARNWLPTWNSVVGRSEIPYQCFSCGNRTHYLWEFHFSSHLIKTFTLWSNQMLCILE